MLKQLNDPVISSVYREQNIVADTLAKYGTTMTDNNHGCLLHSPPPFAMAALKADFLGVPTMRLVNACSSTTLSPTVHSSQATTSRQHLFVNAPTRDQLLGVYL